MSKQTRIHATFSTLTGIAAVVAGICLIFACIGIWGSGEFTREGVTVAFTPISVPVYLCLVLVLAGWGLDVFWPVPRRKVLSSHPMMALNRDRAKADLETCEPELTLAIRAQQKIQKRWAFFAGIVTALCAIVFLSYAVNPAHYSTDNVTGSVKQAVFVLLPCLAAAFAAALAAGHFVLLSAEKEIALLKTVGKKVAEPLTAVPKFYLPVVQGAILAAAIALIAYGAISGGTTDVLAKAVNICTECVGLG
jgi:hypothetical protein